MRTLKDCHRFTERDKGKTWILRSKMLQGDAERTIEVYNSMEEEKHKPNPILFWELGKTTYMSNGKIQHHRTEFLYIAKFLHPIHYPRAKQIFGVAARIELFGQTAKDAEERYSQMCQQCVEYVEYDANRACKLCDKKTCHERFDCARYSFAFRDQVERQVEDKSTQTDDV